MENITPAIQITKTNELTAQEFQKLLHFWFEEKGIESDLRSYLRLKMINILKNTEIGRNLVKPTNSSTSLTKQAIHLIVAEYLICCNCHYTFSIFNTEVSVGGSGSILPDYSTIFDNSKVNSWRFSQDDLINILELIGIPKNSEECNEISNLYYDRTKSNNCILLCILTLLQRKYLQPKCQKPSETSLLKIDPLTEDEFLTNTAQILSKHGILTQTNMTNIFNELKTLYLTEKDEITKTITDFKNENILKDKTISELQRDKKHLERKLSRFLIDHNRFVAQTKEALEYEQKLRKRFEEETAELRKKIVTGEQKELDENCNRNVLRIKELEEENDKLLKENSNQRTQIEKLNQECREVMSEFEMCKSKLDMLNAKLFDENFDRENEKKNVELSDSSECLTEEIVKQARLRLQELELESIEIDRKFQKIVS